MGVIGIRCSLMLVVVLVAFIGDYGVVLGDLVKGVKDEKNLFGKPKPGFGGGLGHGIYKKGFRHVKGGGGGLGGGIGGGVGGGIGHHGGLGGGVGGGVGGGGGLRHHGGLGGGGIGHRGGLGGGIGGGGGLRHHGGLGGGVGIGHHGGYKGGGRFGHNGGLGGGAGGYGGADGTGSVFFLDSSTQRYFRPRSPESQSLLLPEIGAAISVLLGFAPPLTLSPTSSKKEIILDEVLLPNPFDRPRAVFVLEINGVEDEGSGLGMDNDVFVSSLKSRVAFGQNYADIQLSDKEKVSLVSLNEPLTSDMEFTDNILDDFASWLGGSYVRNLVKSLSGELTVPLANDVQLKLHMSKVGAHMDKLLKFRLKALKDQYGSNDRVQQAVELLVTSVSKIYGQIVGVVLFNGSPARESGTMLECDVHFTASSLLAGREKRVTSQSYDCRSGFGPTNPCMDHRKHPYNGDSVRDLLPDEHDIDKGCPSLFICEA
ncbi:hypothetical protein Ccrd_021404 [Cynara cardunculus var. scolymus]|uniref:DUF7794 domain-containing protein n=1 Tax=Cynara cardunculus var. scolymus TaxID=59895 RepID=A0A124SEL4_CYNCS|nr:hypothetical protein Ccrd_021404 [Cynara cardunculus var. scolymus]